MLTGPKDRKALVVQMFLGIGREVPALTAQSPALNPVVRFTLPYHISKLYSLMI